jgi:glycosyltransferase involved in cell wall biosynthesis
MNIGFDAKRAVQNNTGLGNYSRFVLEIMSEFFPDSGYFLFAPKNRDNQRLAVLKSRRQVKFVFPRGFAKIFPSLWRIFGDRQALKQYEIDFFHGLSNELPLFIPKNIKTAVTVHDLIFLRYPQFYRPVDRWIYRQKFRIACKTADIVIAVSECTKRDITDFFGIPEEKIRVVYQSCHPQFKTVANTGKIRAVREKYSLPEDFILFVGSIEQRKNLLLAVKALKYLPEAIHLVALGKSTDYQREIESYARLNNLVSRLHIFNNFPFEEFPAVYQMARVFVYPSFFEGFGIPVIEALNSGTPVVAALGSCLEEAGGPDSFYVDPTNERELASRISEILNSRELADRMSIQGKKYAEKFDPRRIAGQLYEIYNEF